MLYKKTTYILIIASFAFALISNVVFAATDVSTNDLINNSVFEILRTIQKYSWPVVTLLFIFALYKFFIAGIEVIAAKAFGQKMIIGIAIFMVIVQSMPLIYALLII